LTREIDRQDIHFEGLPDRSPGRDGEPAFAAPPPTGYGRTDGWIERAEPQGTTAAASLERT
jgi:hypothetical protein